MVGKEWAPSTFSSRFICRFCAERFRKGYKLKLQLSKAELDGCVYKYSLCGNNPVAIFTRHIKDVHSLSRAQYKAEYGGSEVVSRMFQCELCGKEVKHTIGAHMKMVHLIS